MNIDSLDQRQSQIKVDLTTESKEVSDLQVQVDEINDQREAFKNLGKKAKNKIVNYLDRLSKLEQEDKSAKIIISDF